MSCPGHESSISSEFLYQNVVAGNHQETSGMLLQSATSFCKRNKNLAVSCLKKGGSIMFTKTWQYHVYKNMTIMCNEMLPWLCLPCLAMYVERMEEQGMSIERTVDKPGFQIYAYLVSYILSTSTNMQLSSYKWVVMPTVPAMPNIIM